MFCCFFVACLSWHRIWVENQWDQWKDLSGVRLIGSGAIAVIQCGGTGLAFYRLQYSIQSRSSKNQKITTSYMNHIIRAFAIFARVLLL